MIIGFRTDHTYYRVKLAQVEARIEALYLQAAGIEDDAWRAEVDAEIARQERKASALEPLAWIGQSGP